MRSESHADQAAISVFVGALLGTDIEHYPRPFRAHGWSTVFNLLPGVLRELHYNTDVDALAVVMDSDRTLPHSGDHDKPDGADSACRMCRLRQVIAQEQERLTPTGRLPVRVAVGLAVPCLEAWLRCGHDRGVTEAAWRVALRENKFPYDSRRLKQAVYGTDRPSIHLETQHMVEEAQRLASRLSELETWFPGGFKPFADAVRSWVPPATPQPPAETS